MKVNPFVKEFQDILCHLASLPHQLVILGDFSLHVDIQSNQTEQVLEIFVFLLSKQANFPTHIYGHSLDVLVTPVEVEPKQGFQSDKTSDHYRVIADFYIDMHSLKDRSTTKQRNFKLINIDAFRNDIRQSALIRNPSSIHPMWLSQYNIILTSIL